MGRKVEFAPNFATLRRRCVKRQQERHKHPDRPQPPPPAVLNAAAREASGPRLCQLCPRPPKGGCARRDEAALRATSESLRAFGVYCARGAARARRAHASASRPPPTHSRLNVCAWQLGEQFARHNGLAPAISSKSVKPSKPWAARNPAVKLKQWRVENAGVQLD